MDMQAQIRGGGRGVGLAGQSGAGEEGSGEGDGCISWRAGCSMRIGRL